MKLGFCAQVSRKYPKVFSTYFVRATALTPTWIRALAWFVRTRECCSSRKARDYRPGPGRLIVVEIHILHPSEAEIRFAGEHFQTHAGAAVTMQSLRGRASVCCKSPWAIHVCAFS